jgi:hypothetical protein
MQENLINHVFTGSEAAGAERARKPKLFSVFQFWFMDSVLRQPFYDPNKRVW